MMVDKLVEEMARAICDAFQERGGMLTWDELAERAPPGERELFRETYRHAAQACAAIAQKRLAEWQPIETAPRDGTRILVTDGNYFTAARWADRAIWYHDNPVAFVAENEQSPDHDGHFDLIEPTHWMPLAETPHANLSGEASATGS